MFWALKIDCVENTAPFPWSLQISIDNSKAQRGPRTTVGRQQEVSEPPRKRRVPIRLQEEAESPLVRYIYTHTQCMRECNPGSRTGRGRENSGEGGNPQDNQHVREPRSRGDSELSQK